eukprot:m.50884 g.50884  ORF g.50884 m.50884 type:complete len:86 (+) comp21359_c0_seq1:352-609(+)
MTWLLWCVVAWLVFNIVSCVHVYANVRFDQRSESDRDGESIYARANNTEAQNSLSQTPQENISSACGVCAYVRACVCTWYVLSAR